MARVCLILSFLIFFSQAVNANCFVNAGKVYHIDPLLLEAIAIQESHLNPYAFNGKNNNHSYDIGLMQINSNHFKKLISYGIDPHRLYTEPCLSVYTGAWILAGNFYSHGYSWNSVGAYNAGFSKNSQHQRSAYADKIKRIYIVLKNEKVHP